MLLKLQYIFPIYHRILLSKLAERMRIYITLLSETVVDD